MQAVTQSYSSQQYSHIQLTTAFPGNRTASSKQNWSHSQASQDDSISLSPEGRQLSRTPDAEPAGDEMTREPKAEEKKENNQQELSQNELKTLTELKRRDTEVRTHEQAHLSAAGQYAAGGASFSYTTGPDGKRYASGGEVPIDIGKEKTPEATIQKMRTVRRAALAPASPSSADRSIAAQASAKEARAMKELQAQPEELSGNKGNSVNVAESKETQSEENNSEANATAVPVSEYSRRSMTSAYQANAALAT